VREVLLPYREPMTVSATFDFLAARAITGIEQYHDGVFSRVLAAAGGPALVRLCGAAGGVRCELRLTSTRDEPVVLAAVRRLLDLDADAAAIDAALGADGALGPLVRKRPGLRSPGAADGFELAVRAVVGQQVSVAGARTVLGRIAAAYGSAAFAGQPWRVFPTAEQLAGADPDALPMPRARGRTIVALARAWCAGALRLTPEADPAEQRRALLAVAGIGPWTADYIAMRALGDRDVLLAGDLGVRRGAAALGIDLSGGRPEWAPWRSYATHHLWAAH
jgi:AraC family transcriptional regulator of adaptative response / DNA-3-methyladenine glycosylase II